MNNKENKPFAAPASQHGEYDRAFDPLYLDVMNIICDDSKANEEYSDRRIAYKHGHRDARHAAADLVAEFATRFHAEGGNTCDKASSDAAVVRAAPADADDLLWTIRRNHDLGAVHDSRGELIAQSYYADMKALTEAHNAAIKVFAAEGATPAGELVWQPLTEPGQVIPGTKLRFTIGDQKFNETAKVILNPNAKNEEIIYNKARNFYLITSLAISGKGNAKNVEFLGPRIDGDKHGEQGCGK